MARAEAVRFSILEDAADSERRDRSHHDRADRKALEDVIPWRVDVVTAGAVRKRMAQVIDDAVAL